MSPRALASAGVALAIASVAVLLLQWHQWSDIPADEDWEAAIAAARADWSDSAAFRVDPGWESRPRVFMGASSWVPAEEPTWFDLAPYDRIALVSERGREVARFPEPWTSKGPPVVFGTVELRWFERTASTTTWDVLSALKTAKVQREYKDKTVRCDRWESGDFPAWQCGKRDKFLYVGEALEPVTNDVHRCLWAMPIDKAGRLRIRFDQVPEGRLTGYLGQTLPAVRSKRGEPVQFEVFAGGESVLARTLDVGDEGFLAWDAGRIPAGTVEFVVQSQNQVDRFFCFAARVESRE
jgi:hypothetical protein